MNLTKIIQGLRNRVVPPRVYALVVTFPEGTYLSLQSAYSLEEAFGLAKKELATRKPTLNATLFSIGQFDVKDFGSLSERFIESPEIQPGVAVAREIPAVSPVASPPPAEKHSVFDKLEVMKTIVEKKDKELYESNKLGFTDPEKQYLEEKLGYKKSKKQ
jgi:hypothetical protein